MTTLDTIRVPLAELAGIGPDLRPAPSATPFVAVYEIDCAQLDLHPAEPPAALAFAAERSTTPRDPVLRRRAALMDACMRWVLGAHLRVPANDVPLKRNARGRPSLDPAPPGSSLAVSSTRCDNRGAIAVASSGAVGVDLERVDAVRLPQGVAAHILHPRELARFERVGASARPMWLTTAWVCKEAALKALGLGLALDPREVEVTTGRPELGGDEALFSLPGRPGLYGHLRRRGSFVLALVASPAPLQVSYRRLVFA